MKNQRFTAIILSLIMALSLLPAQYVQADSVVPAEQSQVTTAEQQANQAEQQADQHSDGEEGNSDGEEGAADKKKDEADAQEEDQEDHKKSSRETHQKEREDDSDDGYEYYEYPDEEDYGEYEEQFEETYSSDDELSDEADDETAGETDDESDDESDNEDGDFVEYEDEEGNKRRYDREDPEFGRYFQVPEEDPIALAYNPDEDDSLLEAWRGDRSDPYCFPLTGYDYRYPGYFKALSAEMRPEVRSGFDISYYQGDISVEDFRQMKDVYGIDFAIIRAGYRGYGDAGNIRRDTCFSVNIANAREAGLEAGVYFFSQATSVEEAVEEARYCMNVIGDDSELVSLPVIIDYEYSGNPGRLAKAALSPEAHTEIVNAFCETVEEEGYRAGIYANKSMIEQDLVLDDIPDDYYIWMANFVSVSNPPVSTKYEGRLNSWQFTSAFTGFGTAGLGYMATKTLDLDFWYGQFPDEAERCEISYHSNGGFGDMDITAASAGDTVSIGECAYTRDGCTFGQWNTEPDGSGQAYMAGEKITLSEPLTDLYAIWECTIAFDTDDGSYIPDVTAVADRIMEEPDIPVKVDYTFGGWYEDEDYSRRWDFATDTVIRDTTLHAMWIVDEAKSWGDLDDPANADAKSYILETYESPADISDSIWIYGICDMPYTGKAVTLEDLKVFHGKRQLRPGTDMNVKYQNNVRSGQAKVVITGKGNYSGTYTGYFNILPLDTKGRITAEDISLRYNGRIQKGTTVVMYTTDDGRKVTLKPGSDYTLIYPGTDKKKPEEYDSNAFVGYTDADSEHEVTIKFKGNYDGEASFTETILKKQSEKIPVSSLSIGRVNTQMLSYDDSGKLVSAVPDIVARYKGRVVEQGAEDGYTLQYINNDVVGTASVFLTGTGLYTGSRRIDFKVSAVPMSKVKITNTTGGAELRYYPDRNSEGIRLVAGRDYELVDSNSYVRGRVVTNTYKGIGIYSGTIRDAYIVKSIPLATDGIQNPDIHVYMNHNAMYTRGGTKPRIQVTYTKDGTSSTLEEGVDYTLRYYNNSDINDGTNPKKCPNVVITGKGLYTGKLTADYVIMQSDIGRVHMSANDIVYANRSGICRPKLTVTDINGTKLVAGKDYEKSVAYTYADSRGVNVDVTDEMIIPAGTVVTATITGKGCYRGTKSASFRFVEADISKAVVKIAPQYYTGRPVTVEKGDFTSAKVGKNELTGEDFDIVPGSYVNNINTGTAKVTVVGRGRYGGTRTVTFKIVKKAY